VVVETQLRAFQAGLTRARQIYRQTGVLPPISIAFDHKGIFRKQFVAEGLSNSQKRNPRLSQLHTDITDVFLEVSDRIGIDLEHVFVLHEDSAKTYLSYLREQGQIPIGLVRRVFASVEDEGGFRVKATCAGITAAYFRKAAELSEQPDDESPDEPVLEVFFENDPWSSTSVYIRGLLLAHELGVQQAIRLHLAMACGNIVSGKIARPTSSPKSALLENHLSVTDQDSATVQAFLPDAGSAEVGRSLTG
jgi:hypothetical protein